MKDWLMKYWLQALFGIIVVAITAEYRKLACKVSNKTREQEAIKLGIQALLRDRIIDSYNHYFDKGYCPIYALENFEALYTQYHTLGGNGTITKLMEKIRELPTEPRESQEG